MADQTTTKRSKLAIASFVLGLLSCLLLPAPIAFVLGVIALVQTGKDPNLTGRNFAVAGLALSVVFGMLSLLMSIAIPSFLTFGARSKQSECKTNLKSIFTSAKSLYMDKDHYTADFVGLDWKPERPHRYAYITAATPVALDEGLTLIMPSGVNPMISREQVSAALSTTQLAGGVRPGVEGVCPDECHFTAMCVSNLDGDDGVDVWSISTKNRQAKDGTPVPAGTPHLEVNDLED